MIKVETFEKSIDKLTQIAEDLKDPNLAMRNFLILRGMDSTKAKEYSFYPRGATLDSLGNKIPNSSYLQKKPLPNLGVYMFVKSNGIEMLLDTLWDFRRKE